MMQFAALCLLVLRFCSEKLLRMVGQKTYRLSGADMIVMVCTCVRIREIIQDFDTNICLSFRRNMAEHQHCNRVLSRPFDSPPPTSFRLRHSSYTVTKSVCAQKKDPRNLHLKGLTTE
ncbi:hypothetical protein CHARACLAT_001851 [Characodon lateralis]|uniref:Secreted protein n=1 Tax=Characodon lateralis TaxID=208331 RepID=A0ABU7DCV4_9TELE|nr:hypothetical protein [Characodon lateralis]